MAEITLDFIKQTAKNIGLEEISAVATKKLPEFTEKFRKWLDLGYNGTMSFLKNNIEKRENPEILLAGAKTLIVAIQSYPANVNFNGELKIAKYALAEDYHISLKNKLQNLMNIIQEKFAGKYYISVDSGAVFEKEWAVIAGLGWRGKNSLIINQKYGSYFNIGVIITDLILAEENVDTNKNSSRKNSENSENNKKENKIIENKIIESKCGDCELCKKSCPTNAIIDFGVIDARKCISYLTIEAKLSEDIFLEKEIAASKYIFGCDICQDVCPHNSIEFNKTKSNVTTNKYINITKKELYNLSNKEFNEKFVNSAIKRLRANRLKRNLDFLDFFCLFLYFIFF